MSLTSIKVRHNFEAAHRLSLLPGKCEQIHGHSFWAELEIRCGVDQAGIGLEFGEVKRLFRNYLDTNFDHRLLLNSSDLLVRVFPHLPGVVLLEGDPTTENLAKWIYQWAGLFSRHPNFLGCRVTVQETAVNAASHGDWA